MSRRRRDRSWPPAGAVAPLATPVTDNHTHLPVPGLPAEGPGAEAPLSAAELVSRAADAGVRSIITSACQTPAWEGSIGLARTLPGVRVALAVHPNEAVAHAGVREVGPDGLTPVREPYHDEPLDLALARLERLVRDSRDVVVAVGETGLDLFRTGACGAAVQRAAFRDHVALAKETGLPLQIHDGAPERTVFHCFSGGEGLARACADHGWYASVAGPVTYPANDALRAALAHVPDELLLVETDAPYLPPAPWRGRPNASYLMGETVRFLAEQRGLTEDETCVLLARNTEMVYGAEYPQV